MTVRLLCRFARPALAGAFVSPLASFLQAVRFAFDRDDLGQMHEAIDERDDTGGVREHFVPFGERSIRCHDPAVVLVSPANQLEQQILMAIRVREVSEGIRPRRLQGHRAQHSDASAGASFPAFSLCISCISGGGNNFQKFNNLSISY